MAPAFGVEFCEHHDEGGPEPECEEPLGPNIELSKAIHAYLSAEDRDNRIEGDVDWYKFVLDADELSLGTTGKGNSARVSGTALPWRCAAYTNSFPTIALIGPGLPRLHGHALHALPTEVQDALNSSDAGKEKWGIFIAENPNPSPMPRRSSHFTNGINVDWWGGSPAILFSDDSFRGRPNGSHVTEPGTYHLVVWDPKGDALNYTLSTGFYEQDTEEEDIIGDGTRLLFDNDMLLNFQCNDPCDGVADRARDFDQEVDDLKFEDFFNKDAGVPNCNVPRPLLPLEDGICGCIRGV